MPLQLFLTKEILRPLPQLFEKRSTRTNPNWAWIDFIRLWSNMFAHSVLSVALPLHALHSLFGEYVKRLKEHGHLESEMTARILKSSISTLEAFNDVRNNQSLAHDNPILNYDEALLIFITL